MPSALKKFLKKNKKQQSLIVFLWILAFAAILFLGGTYGGVLKTQVYMPSPKVNPQAGNLGTISTYCKSQSTYVPKFTVNCKPGSTPGYYGTDGKYYPLNSIGSSGNTCDQSSGVLQLGGIPGGQKADPSRLVCVKYNSQPSSGGGTTVEVIKGEGTLTGLCEKKDQYMQVMENKCKVGVAKPYYRNIDISTHFVVFTTCNNDGIMAKPGVLSYRTSQGWEHTDPKTIGTLLKCRIPN